MKTSKKRNIQKAEKYYDKGVEYGTVGKFEAAKAEFKKALNVDPSYVPAKNSLMIIKDLTDNKIKNKTAVHIFKAIDFQNNDMPGKEITELKKAIKHDAYSAQDGQ